MSGAEVGIRADIDGTERTLRLHIDSDAIDIGALERAVLEAVMEARSAAHLAHIHERFSQEGFETFRRSIDGYIWQLARESDLERRRWSATQISPAYVDAAARRVTRGGAGRAGRVRGTVGSLMLGAVLSYLLTTLEHPTTANTVAMLAAAVIGTLLLKSSFSS